MTSSDLPQVELDYAQEAMCRVAYDTNAQQASVAFPLTDGQTQYDLPDDCQQLISVVGLGDQLSVGDVLGYLSGGAAPTGYTVIGRTLYAYGATGSATLTYKQRPPDLDSSSPFPYTGEVEGLITTRALADRLDDDRQDELSAAHEEIYQRDAQRIRMGLTGQAKPRRIAMRGWD